LFAFHVIRVHLSLPTVFCIECLDFAHAVTAFVLTIAVNGALTSGEKFGLRRLDARAKFHLLNEAEVLRQRFIINGVDDSDRQCAV
jgi:hypothetical protein